jgi:DNA-binding transcriptional MerR regulator
VDKGPDAYRTISEVADDLDLPQHVLRFWETRFGQIRPLKRGGGRRYYRPDDVELLRGIRHLLYSEGYTIRGVQRILKEEGPRAVQKIWREDERAATAFADRLPPPAPSSVPAHRAEAAAGEDAFEDFAGRGADDVRFEGHAPNQPCGAFPPNAIRDLQQVLAELAECRRLLGLARGAEAGDGDGL